MLTARGVEGYAGLAVQTELLVVLYLSQRCVVDHEVGLEVCEFLFARLDEHILNEVCLPCYLNDETNGHAGVLVSAAECVNDVQVLVAELLNSQFFYLSPNLFGHRVVVVLVALGGPPNGVLRVLVHDDVFVLRRTAGIDTGHHVNGVELGVLTLLVAGQLRLGLLLKEVLVGRIVCNYGSARNAILSKIQFFHLFDMICLLIYMLTRSTSNYGTKVQLFFDIRKCACRFFSNCKFDLQIAA